MIKTTDKFNINLHPDHTLTPNMDVSTVKQASSNHLSELAMDFLSAMNFWLPNEALTSSNHLIVSAMDFLSAMNFSDHLMRF